MPPAKHEDSNVEINLEIRQGERVRMVLTHPEDAEEFPPSIASQPPASPAGWRERAKRILNTITSVPESRITWVLFFLGLLVYLLVMGIHLTGFPVITEEERLNTALTESLLRSGLQNRLAQFSPACFLVENDCLPTGPVFLQVLPQILFAFQLWASRGMMVLVGLAAAVFLSLTLRSGLKKRLWWSAPLWLALSPGWFVLSRSASGGMLLALCWAAMIYSYLRCRDGHSRSVYALMFFAALSLYSTRQAAVGTFLLLLWISCEYLFAHRRAWPPKSWPGVLGGIAFGLLLALPWLASPLNSLQGTDFGAFFSNYFFSLSPVFWLGGETLGAVMPGFGAFPWLALPFTLFGLFLAVRGFRDHRLRTLLACLALFPLSAAAFPGLLAEAIPLLLPFLALAVLGLSAVLERLPAPRRYWGAVFAVLTLLALLMLNAGLI